MFILSTNWWILGTPGSVDAGSGRRSNQMKAFVAFVANLSLLANIWDVSVIIILAKITLVTKREIIINLYILNGISASKLVKIAPLKCHQKSYQECYGKTLSWRPVYRQSVGKSMYIHISLDHIDLER